MQSKEIDYDDSKKRGFLRARHEGKFTLRTRMPAGNYSAKDLAKLSEIAKKYGKGVVHMTLRQGVEIPYIRYEEINEVEKEIKKAGLGQVNDS